MRSVLVATFAILAFVSCTGGSDLTVSQQNLIREDVTRTLHNYYHDINRSGLMAELNYLDDSPDFFWVPPGYGCSIAYDSVVNILTRTAAIYRSVNNKFTTLKVFPLTDRHATYTATIQCKMIDTTGVESRVSLLETGLMIKRNDGWKLLNGQTSVSDR